MVKRHGIGIIGSRFLLDEELIIKTIDKMINKRRGFAIDFIVTDEKGAAAITRTYVDSLSAFKTRLIKTLWEKNGPSAAYTRNEEIIKASTEIVFFWDGEDEMIAKAIEEALAVKKRIFVVRHETLKKVS